MSNQTKPKKGDWARVRRVWNDDHTDTMQDDGVVVGEPRETNDWHYDVLSPYESTPFQGHNDDAQIVPDSDLTSSEKSFKKHVIDMLNKD